MKPRQVLTELREQMPDASAESVRAVIRYIITIVSEPELRGGELWEQVYIEAGKPNLGDDYLSAVERYFEALAANDANGIAYWGKMARRFDKEENSFNYINQKRL